MSTGLEGLPQLYAELWFVMLLRKRGGLEVHDGVTTTAERAERLRRLILRERLDREACGRTRGDKVTFAELFERIYGEPLITEAMRAQADELRRRHA